MTQPKKSSKKTSTEKSTKKVAAPTTSKKVAARAVSAKAVKMEKMDKSPEVKLAMSDAAPLTLNEVVVPELVQAVEVQPEVVTKVVPEVVAEVVAAPTREVTRAEFMAMVRKEAYRRAAMRNFRNGSPFQDWVNAEAAVSGKLAAEGARLS
jgi:hypothetical protein